MINLEDLDIKNTPDEQLEGTRMMLENDMRQLARQRSQDGTYEDAYAGYEALVEEANKAINEALDHQAFTLKRMGKFGTSNTQLDLGNRFSQYAWILEDHFGDKILLDAVKEQDYGMSHEEYQTQRNTIQTAIADIAKELAERKAKRATAEVERVYQSELERIGG